MINDNKLKILWEYTSTMARIWLWIGLFCVFFASCTRYAYSQESELKMAIIAKIESSNNPKAFNPKTKATGLYQITPICLKDYNQFHAKKYLLTDMFNPVIGEMVANWYLNQRIPQLLKHYGREVTIRNQIIAYNAGIKYVGKRLPKETINYLNKYNKLNKGL